MFFQASNAVFIFLIPKSLLALSHPSRHAVRDHLTLKRLDFTLKAHAPQMSAEFCRQFSLIHAQTLPEGSGGAEANTAWVVLHMSIQLLNSSVLAAQMKDEGN